MTDHIGGDHDPSGHTEPRAGRGVAEATNHRGTARPEGRLHDSCARIAGVRAFLGGALARLVVAGQATIAYHPMNFLDQASTTNY